MLYALKVAAYEYVSMFDAFWDYLRCVCVNKKYISKFGYNEEIYKTKNS